MSDKGAPVGAYKMNTFAKLTGLSPAVLRAWERRHALLEPVRLGGGHRAYTEEDLRVIERVRELMGSGRSIGEVALIGRTKLLEELGGPLVHMPKANADRLEALKDAVVEGARTIQSPLIHRALDEAFAMGSPTTVVDRVVMPAAIEIGEKWRAGELSIAGEHLATSALKFRVQKLLEMASSTGEQRDPVVCACVPGERHELGLLVLALNIARTGQSVSYLGANMPLDDLAASSRSLAPSAFCLSVTCEETLLDAKKDLVAFGQQMASGPAVYLGGRGITTSHPDLADAGIHVWQSNRDAADLIQALKDNARAVSFRRA